ncbi:LacI family DNA-binding transcriptional regulator [Kocuria sp.]|uniref:LacI family DNA-binding transcriptional regulator n=1 Tax=Kocuria sp. TaxID=1871328 RepID=UPI0026E01674|nr:LacI family DNA-binding transcriptional regulator [Kocuria sp.]MDO5617895.1 LacI family DNA-binding transcriptional regulator [Kocuria sp.]
MSRTTIKDVAAEAGVSLGTASRALSGNGSVAAPTRERVLLVARRLNFVPNGQAGSLRSERTNTIGLLIPDIRNPFFAELAHVVEQGMRAEGLSVILCSANEDPEQMHDYATVLRRQRVDGIIVAPFSTAREPLQELRETGMPLVFLDRTIPGMGVPAVVSDTRIAIAEAVTYLVAQGAQKIGYISGPSGTTTGVERLAEFHAAAEDAGIAAEVAHGDFQELSGRLGMRSLLSKGINAVLAADSLMTIGAFKECRAAGIMPVRDLPFVGFDDIAPFALLQPPLPLICQDLQAMGASAVELLLAQLAGEKPSSQLRLQAHLRLPVDSRISLPNHVDQNCHES